ncbi:proteasome regulatory particle base subunit, partial [Coemansia spiralis]
MAVQVEALTSATGLISLLDEDERELQYYGLVQLNAVTDRFWAEISDAISRIEILYEDETFPHRQLAALVASKIYFHLGEFDDALGFAMGAGELFKLTETSAYVQTVVNHAVDKYIELRSGADGAEVDSRLVAVVERMFERCFATGEYVQVIGIAIETRRLDVLERALVSGDTQSLLAYVQRECIDLIRSIRVQGDVQELLFKVHMQYEAPDYEAVCLCLSKLNHPQRTAAILGELAADASEDMVLAAYQIAFELEANATQEFTKAVVAELAAHSGEDNSGDAGSLATERLISILRGDETRKLHLDF